MNDSNLTGQMQLATSSSSAESLDNRSKSFKDAIALHNTLEIPKYKRPEIELVYEGVNVDVLGIGFHEIADSAREEVLAAFPRLNFKEVMPRTFAEAIFHKPQTGWANTMGDAVERFLPGYVRPNFCDIIAGTTFRD